MGSIQIGRVGSISIDNVAQNFKILLRTEIRLKVCILLLSLLI